MTLNWSCTLQPRILSQHFNLANRFTDHFSIKQHPLLLAFKSSVIPCPSQKPKKARKKRRPRKNLQLMVKSPKKRRRKRRRRKRNLTCQSQSNGSNKKTCQFKKQWLKLTAGLLWTKSVKNFPNIIWPRRPGTKNHQRSTNWTLSLADLLSVLSQATSEQNLKKTMIHFWSVESNNWTTLTWSRIRNPKKFWIWNVYPPKLILKRI